MLLKNGITHASDVELLAAVLGNRGTVTTLLWQAGGSPFSLLGGVSPEAFEHASA